MGATLGSGHYVAYVRHRPQRITVQPVGKGVYDQSAAHDGKWFRTSDTSINECKRGFAEVNSCEAYMLFYELLPKM